MKAFLLSAGLGKRLRPITNEIPKCLVPINNIPLIEYWFRLFRKYGIKDILINTHYLHEKIMSYIETNAKDLNISIKYEPNLLGSLGCILINKDFISRDESFLVFYSDNLTNLNLRNFISYHKSHEFPITMGLFRCSNPRQSGIFINKKGQKFAIFSTMYGDGIYLDNNGDSYGVDSGTIGAYPIESFDEVNELGQGVEFIDEGNVDYDEETGIISFGNIHIHTDPFDEVNDSN